METDMGTYPIVPQSTVRALALGHEELLTGFLTRISYQEAFHLEVSPNLPTRQVKDSTTVEGGPKANHFS